MAHLAKCFFCDKLKHLPISITEITGDNVESHLVCKECGEEFMGKKKKQIDLTYIETPEQLLAFIEGAAGGLNIEDADPCSCGMTLKEFDEHGRFGCPKCYEHFTQIMEKLVYPFHNARQHVGKRPLRQMREDPVEQLKILKLQYAKALELEEYEKCPEILKKIEEVKISLQATSEDQ